jgi:hypothetical protein
MKTQNSQSPHDPIIPDVSRILTTDNFEKAIRSSLERAAAKDAANARPPTPTLNLSAIPFVARLRRFVARGAGAIRRHYRRRRQ